MTQRKKTSKSVHYTAKYHLLNERNMSERTNPAFVSDEGYTTNTTNGNISKEDYCLELKDLKSKETTATYNPYEHRNVAHPTTNSETLLHLLKGSLGTGILAMPNAFKNSGYILGFVGTAIIGLICTYCIHMLISAEYELCKRKKEPSMTYPGTAVAAFSEGPRILKKFSPYAGHVVNTFLLIYQLGTCCVYIVFISENVKAVMDQYVTKLDIEIYMVIFLLPLILINWIRNLKLLAPFSTLANCITVVSFGFILYYIVKKGVKFEDREAVADVTTFPLYFGTVLFALEAIGVIMPLENEMKTPKSFGSSFGVLNIAMVVIVSLYIGMGFFGYLAYGADVQGSITLNLEKNEVMAQVVKCTLALAIFISYSLQCYVAVDITWHGYISPRVKESRTKIYWEYLARTALVLVTFLLAVAIPNLELFISLFGALCLSALGIAIPAIINLCTYWDYIEGSKFYLSLAKNVVLIIFGIIGLVVGTYTSLEKIVEKFSN